MNTKLILLTAALLTCQPALANDGRGHGGRDLRHGAEYGRHNGDDHGRHHGDDHGRGRDSQLVWARVTHVSPIYDMVETRVPYEECRTAYGERGRADSATPAIVGAIAGAALGNGIGHNKTNKTIGAVAGGLLGASIGHDIGQNMNPGRGYQEAYQVCDTRYRVEHHREITGYHVSYRYDGHRYTTRTHHHPGNRMQVWVHIEPARH